MEFIHSEPTTLRALSTTFRRILEDALIEARVERNSIEIKFERPSNEGFLRSTINLFLYDITENAQVRESFWNQSDSRGNLRNDKRPVRIDVSYRVSCWTSNPEDEHDLLWIALGAFYRNSPVTIAQFSSDLAAIYQKPLHTRIASGNGTLSSLTEFWSAVGGPFHPSFSVTATLEMEVAPMRQEGAAPPVRELDVRVSDARCMLSGQVLRHTVTDSGRIGTSGLLPSATPVSQARLHLEDVAGIPIGDSINTNDLGEFEMKFGRLPGGTYTLVASSKALGKTRISVEIPALIQKVIFRRDGIKIMFEEHHKPA